MAVSTRKSPRNVLPRVERSASPTPVVAPAATAPAAPVPPKSPWILNRGWDLLLFIGTPLVLLPLFAAAQVRWTAQEIYLWVGAFGAMGHHLPGMIRAYGDGALFDRFKVRFVLAPLLLVAVCMWSSIEKWQALNLVAFVWGVWHGMMQTYGFCRIYDMKGFPGAAARGRLDFLLCGAWFLGGVLLSPLRGRSLLNLYYESGGPLIPPVALDLARWAAMAALAVITLWWAWSHWRAVRRGEPVPITKLAILASSLSFWWYCNLGVSNILVGIALFEVFHDVQYLSIVWLYNRARVEKDRNIGGFMRFVFRRSGALAGLYVGLVLAYGGIGLVTAGVSSDLIQRLLLGLVTASALLHFYYDGFIWKVRESSTRESLGVAGGATATESAVTLLKTPWLRHAGRWAVLAIPFGLLCMAQARDWRMNDLERREQVALAFPRDGQAQLDFGKVLHEQSRLDEAGARYEAAAGLNPSLPSLDYYRGLLAGDRGDIATAEAAYRRELARDPRAAEAETNLAAILLVRNQPRAAQQLLEHSLQVKPRQVLARRLLGDLLIDEGDYVGAMAQFEAAVKEQPDYKEAADRLAFARTLAGQRNR